MVALFKFYFNLSNIVLIFEITYFYFGFKHYVRTTSLFCPKSFILSSFSIFDDNFTLCSKWLIQLHNKIPRIFPSKLCVGKLAFMAFLEEFIYWKILLFLNLEKNEAIIYFHYRILNWTVCLVHSYFTLKPVILFSQITLYQSIEDCTFNSICLLAFICSAFKCSLAAGSSLIHNGNDWNANY